MEDGRRAAELKCRSQSSRTVCSPSRWKKNGLPVCSQWQTVSAELLLAGLPFASRWSRGEEDVWLAASSSD